jgi:hypothetical protein
LKELYMKMNVGGADKMVRIAAGVILLSLTVFLEGSARWLGLIGLLPLVTGLVGYCPLYAVLGLNTSRAYAGAH